MDSDTLNETIRTLDSNAAGEPKFSIAGLEDTGKVIPYIGWFWRDVNFDGPRYTLGFCGSFVGFMQSNKWGYPQWSTTPAQTTEIRRLIERALTMNTVGAYQVLFDYMQTCLPEGETPDSLVASIELARQEYEDLYR